jgi:hypothetical protein
VPGYDRCCPYGTRLQTFGNSIQLKPVANVPEGRCDRSLARSAWDSATPKEPSRRVRYDRAQLIPEVFLVKMCAVFLKEG